MCMVGPEGEHRHARAERHREHYAAPAESAKPVTIEELEARLRKLEERVGSNEMADAVSRSLDARSAV